jgi:hypothetical protein
MVLSCVLCMSLIVFIYVYHELFVCSNLVDVISLFFTVFSFHLPIFNKIRLISAQTARKSSHRFSKKPSDLSVKLTDLSVLSVSLFLRRL